MYFTIGHLVCSTCVFCSVSEVMWYASSHYFFLFLVVLAACLKAFAVGAPLEPGLRIFSLLPAAIRLRLAWMFSYRPATTTSPYLTSTLLTSYLLQYSLHDEL